MDKQLIRAIFNGVCASGEGGADPVLGRQKGRGERRRGKRIRRCTQSNSYLNRA